MLEETSTGHLGPPLAQSRATFKIRPGCSEPRPIKMWKFWRLKSPQPLWALCSSTLFCEEFSFNPIEISIAATSAHCFLFFHCRSEKTPCSLQPPLGNGKAANSSLAPCLGHLEAKPTHILQPHQYVSRPSPDHINNPPWPHSSPSLTLEGMGKHQHWTLIISYSPPMNKAFIEVG